MKRNRVRPVWRRWRFLFIGIVGITAVASIPVAAQTIAISPPLVDDSVERYSAVMIQTIIVNLEQQGFSPVRLDEAVTADLLLESQIMASPPRAILTASVTDVASGVTLTAATVRGRTNLTLLNSVDELVGALESELLAYRVALEQGRTTALLPVALSVVEIEDSPEDLQVTAVAGYPVASGNRVPRGSHVQVVYRRDGYYPASASVSAGAERTILTPPPLREQHRRGLQVHTTWGRLLGAGIGARQYVAPDRLFVGLEWDLFFTPSETRVADVLHTDVRGNVGLTVAGTPAGTARLVVGTGGGVVITALTETLTVPFVDPYWTVGTVSGEVKLGRTLLFARCGFVYAFESGRGLWTNGTGTPNLNPNIAVGTVLLW